MKDRYTVRSARKTPTGKGLDPDHRGCRAATTDKLQAQRLLAASRCVDHYFEQHQQPSLGPPEAYMLVPIA